MSHDLRAQHRGALFRYVATGHCARYALRDPSLQKLAEVTWPDHGVCLSCFRAAVTAGRCVMCGTTPPAVPASWPSPSLVETARTVRWTIREVALALLAGTRLTTRQLDPAESWVWIMDWCRRKRLPPADAAVWEQGRAAWEAHYASRAP